MAKTLDLYLHDLEVHHGVDPRLTALINHLAGTCKEISFKVSQGALAGVLGSAGSENVQGETQKKLDIIANDIMCRACTESGLVSGVASEEMDHALRVPEDCEVGPYLVLFDPLDGSSNIDNRALIHRNCGRCLHGEPFVDQKRFITPFGLCRFQ